LERLNGPVERRALASSRLGPLRGSGDKITPELQLANVFDMLCGEMPLHSGSVERTFACRAEKIADDEAGYYGDLAVA
jgi:hypothetical protein